MGKLIGILVSGVIAAFLVTFFFVGFFGPSGRYVLNAVLIEPQVLKTLNYNDNNPRTYAMDRFVFDEIQVQWFHPKLPKGTLSLSQYAEIYSLIALDKSLPSEIPEAFVPTHAAALSLMVRTESSSAWQKETKLFQEMEIAEQGGYYRVMLHEEASSFHWVYFQHEGLLDKLIEIYGK